MISVITPTHNHKYLREVYQSLCAQTYTDWEWVLCPNNGGKIPLQISQDPRVRVVSVPQQHLGGIGSIKAFAFSQGRGDYLLELDHDDLLAPNALERVVSEFVRTSTDFVYSNFCEFFGRRPHEGNFHFYLDSAKNGWRYRSTGVYSETVAFAPSAASLSLIYYAPNHLRAWTRTFYEKVGGHNPSYALCDDHELLIRTYLTGKMHHLDELLYFYRMGEQNTYKDHLNEIRETTYRLRAQYLETLLVREGELTGTDCVDLGGAFHAPEGFKTADINGPADFVCDLRERWPFEDSSICCFRAHDLFEHLPDKMHTMRELHRCLKPGGYALISVPSALGQGAYQDPTHCSYWVENSFRYYTNPAYARYIRNDSEYFICDRLFSWNINEIPYVKAELRAIKGDMSEVPGVRLFSTKV